MIIFITGATRGIGRATAILAASQGWKIVLQGRNEERLKELKQFIEDQYKTDVYYVVYDVKEIDKIKESILWVKKNVGPIDALVNNAGIMNDQLIGMLQPEKLEETFLVNTHAAIYHMQFVSRVMMKYKKGAIINVSSIMGRFGNAGQVAYSSSKAALIGATLSTAKELAPYNIRVNAVAPGFIETDLVKDLSSDIEKQKVDSIKMNRIGNPSEVAQVIMFLASEAASYVTGQVIGVDGGMVV